MSKGEFMLLFTSEIGLEASKTPNFELNLKKDSKYYNAAVALVEIGFLDQEDAVTDLDEAVTKETVACLCVYNMFFRKNYDIDLKDESKLRDPQACKDAIGHGIVSDDNGYFVAYQKMTYEECQYAIDKMMEIDANSSFEKEDAELDVVLKENVTNITDELDDTTLQVMDPSSPEFNAIVDGMSNVEALNSNMGVQRDTTPKITLLSTTTRQTPSESTSLVKSDYNAPKLTKLANNKNYCTLDEANADDLIVIRIQKNSIQKIFDVGDMLVYGLWTSDKFNQDALGKHKYAFCGEVVSRNDKDYFYTYYTIRIASEEEMLDSAKLNGYNSKENGVEWKSEQLATDYKGLKIGNFVVTGNSVKLSISETVTNPISSWREAQFEVDMTYDFEVKDISVDISGFGEVLTGNIKNAICKLNYTVVNHFNASTEARITPDNNRNGKFLNNLSRSRFTGANAAGATSIKIARLYADIGYGFNIELYVYLTIQMDGTIDITVTNVYGRGFQIKNNKVTKIADKDTTFTNEINLNAEAGVHFDFSLRWVRKKGTPWADLDIEVGLGINCMSKVFVLDEKHKECSSINNGFISNDELVVIKQNADIDFCFNTKLYAYYNISGLNDDTKIGKVIRWFDEDFKLATGDNWTIKQWHFEDGKKVSDCTRKYDGIEDAEVKDAAEDTFELDEYKVVIYEYQCGLVRIIGYPVDEKDIEKMGGITLRVKDKNVATAHLDGNNIIVEAVGEGSTQLTIETKNKRFSQECSITITKNEDYEDNSLGGNGGGGGGGGAF